MSRSIIANLTVGAVSLTNIVEPTHAVSNVGTSHVFEGADTQVEVSANAVIKYINIRSEVDIRAIGNEFSGWYEYAVVVLDEQQSNPGVDALITTNVGTQTIGDLCNNLYRGKCIWNGAIPVSKETPAVMDLKIKVPGKWCKQRQGQYFIFLRTFRSKDGTDSTTQIREVYSHQYKVYI